MNKVAGMVTLWAVLMLACCGPETVEGPQPTETVDQLVGRVVHQWLDVRVMARSEAEDLQAATATWRAAQTLDEFCRAREVWAIGDFRSAVETIRRSEIYRAVAVSDSHLLALIKVKVDAFVYQEAVDAGNDPQWPRAVARRSIGPRAVGGWIGWGVCGGCGEMPARGIRAA